MLSAETRIGYFTVIYLMQVRIGEHEVHVVGEKPTVVATGSAIYTRAWIAQAHEAIHDVKLSEDESGRMSALLILDEGVSTSEVEAAVRALQATHAAPSLALDLTFQYRPAEE